MKNKNKEEKIADKAIANAKAMKEVAQQNVREQLVESFAPQLKKMISNSILELDEDELQDPDELDEPLEDLEESEGEEGEEGEGDAEEVDPEDLEDLEKALDEDGEDEVEDAPEEDFVPQEEPEPEVDPELEEGAYEDMEEEDDEDFMAELQALLEEEEDEEEDPEPEVEPEELSEIEGKKNGDSFDQDAPDEGYHTKGKDHGEDTKALSENEDGGSYTEDGKDTGKHTKKFERVVRENKRLKRALSEINDSLNETVLDTYKTKAFKNLVSSHNLSETAKLRVMRAIDEGKTEKEVNRISSVFESSLPKKSSKKKKKKSLKESKGGRNSSIKKPKGSKKSLNENAGKAVSYEWSSRLADLADIPK